MFATAEPELVADLHDEVFAEAHEGTIQLGIRTVYCVPLKLVRYVEHEDDSDDVRAIGVLYLDSREKGRLRSPAIQHCLETLAAEAAVAIENARLYRESQEKARLDRDMHTAYQFQQGLLPKAPPLHDYFSAAAEMVPCLSIGGDFYDYVDLDGTFGFVLGDVAGKGAAAGLLGARVQEIFAFRAPGTDPATTIATINATMVKKGLPDLSRCSTASCRLAASSPTATPVTIHRCSSARTGYAGSRPTVSSSDYSMKPHTSRRSSP